MSLSIEEIVSTLRAILPPALLVQAETQLEQAEAIKKEEAEEAPPKAKNQLGIILIDNDGRLAGRDDLTALIVQVPQADDLATVPQRLYDASYAQNRVPGKKRWNVVTLGEAGSIKAKVLKEQGGLAIKGGKESVRVIVRPNAIPIA